MLRLTASDGASSASDDVAVAVNDTAQTPLRVESVALSGGPASLVLRIGFTATAGLGYTVQFRESLNGGAWLKLRDIPSQPVSQTVEVTDSTITNSAARYYRIVTPQQP